MKRMIDGVLTRLTLFTNSLLLAANVSRRQLGKYLKVNNFPNGQASPQLSSFQLDSIDENEYISLYFKFLLSIWIDVSLSVVSIFYGIGNGFFQGELLPLFCPQFPDDSKHLIGEIRGDRRPGLLPLDHELDKLCLVLPVHVEGEPIVEVLGRDSPAVGDSFGGMEDEVADIAEEDGLRGGEGEVVFVNHKKFIVYDYLTVIVERLHRVWYAAYKNMEIL